MTERAAKRPPNRRAGGCRRRRGGWRWSEVAPARRWRRPAPRQASAASEHGRSALARVVAGCALAADAWRGSGRMPERAAVKSGDACGARPRAPCARARVIAGWRTPQGWPRRRTGPALWATASGTRSRRDGAAAGSGAAAPAIEKLRSGPPSGAREVSAPARRLAVQRGDGRAAAEASGPGRGRTGEAGACGGLTRTHPGRIGPDAGEAGNGAAGRARATAEERRGGAVERARAAAECPAGPPQWPAASGTRGSRDGDGAGSGVAAPP